MANSASLGSNHATCCTAYRGNKRIWGDLLRPCATPARSQGCVSPWGCVLPPQHWRLTLPQTARGTEDVDDSFSFHFQPKLFLKQCALSISAYHSWTPKQIDVDSTVLQDQRKTRHGNPSPYTRSPKPKACTREDSCPGCLQLLFPNFFTYSSSWIYKYKT